MTGYGKGGVAVDIEETSGVTRSADQTNPLFSFAIKDSFFNSATTLSLPFCQSVKDSTANPPPFSFYYTSTGAHGLTMMN